MESLQSLAVELPCEQGWCPPTVANLQSEQTVHVRGELLKLCRTTHFAAGGDGMPRALFARIILCAPTNYPHSRRYIHTRVSCEKKGEQVLCHTFNTCCCVSCKKKRSNSNRFGARQQNVCSGRTQRGLNSDICDVHAKVLVQKACVSLSDKRMHVYKIGPVNPWENHELGRSWS